MLDEIRVAARSLLRRPGYAAVATTTLALGIGASVAIFAVVDAVLLKPLPFPDSDRIVTVEHHAPGLNLPEMESSPGTVDFYRNSAQTFTPLAAVRNQAVNITGNGEAERINAERVTPEFFDVVATHPTLGRAIGPDDVLPGAPEVLVLTDDAWKTRFGADPAILGRRIEIDGRIAEIVGVMPPGFAYPTPAVQALLPLQMDPSFPFGNFGLGALGRLAPGTTLEQARAELTALQARLPERFPGTEDFLRRAGWNATITRLRDRVVEDVAPALWVLLGGVGLLLLIATGNVANLFLVRAESRRREMALRTALGAGRMRGAMTFLSESLVVGVMGGALGVAIAAAAVRLLVANGPASLPRLHEVALTPSVLGFAGLVTIAATAVLGLLPLAALRRQRHASALRDGGRGATVGRERHRMRKLLIAGQVAMSLVLLVGAQLMLASVRQLRNVDPGFRTEGVLTVGVSLNDNTDTRAATAFYREVAEAVAGLPGVTAAGMTNSLPIERGALNGSSFDIESRPRPDDQLPPVGYYAAVTPGYFETISIPLREGRAPEWRDTEGSPRVIWVNETFAKRFLDGRAIGERIRFGRDTAWSEIVGVVGDDRHAGLREEVQPMAFHPVGVAQSAMSISAGSIVLRTEGDPVALASGVRGVVQRVNAAVPVVNVRTMDEVIARSLAQTSFTMVLLTLAALVALTLGVVGLYGVISYVVGQRKGEIGVRMALGARPGQVRAMVLRQGLFFALGGIAVGLGAAVGVTRLMESLLFEVSARDPWIFAGSAVALVLVSVVASDLPARRAASVEPRDALMAE